MEFKSSVSRVLWVIAHPTKSSPEYKICPRLATVYRRSPTYHAPSFPTQPNHIPQTIPSSISNTPTNLFLLSTSIPTPSKIPLSPTPSPTRYPCSSSTTGPSMRANVESNPISTITLSIPAWLVLDLLMNPCSLSWWHPLGQEARVALAICSALGLDVPLATEGI